MRDVQERSLKKNAKKKNKQTKNEKKTNKELELNESLDSICDIACIYDDFC